MVERVIEQTGGGAPPVDPPPGWDEVLASPARARVLRPHVAGAVGAAPGSGLLTSLVGLVGAELSAREWVEVAAAWGRMASFVASGQLAAVAALDRAVCPDPAAPTRRPGGVPSTRAAADELAPALGIAPVTASRLVALARRADGPGHEGGVDPDDRPGAADSPGLPAGADALGEGRVSMAQFRVLAAVTRGMPAAAAAVVEALAVRIAHRCTTSQLRGRLEECAAGADPAFTARQAARGRTERTVLLAPSPVPGCRRLVADLPLLDAVATWQVLNGAAVAAADAGVRPDGSAEDRGLGQLRADALTALVTGTAALPGDLAGDGGPGTGTRSGLVPTRARLRVLAEVHVVVAAAALAGRVQLPAVVPGHGAVDVEEVRRVATAVPWRRLVADDATGVLLHHDGALHAPRAPQERPPDDEVADASADPRWGAVLGSPVVPEVLDHGLGRYVPPAALRAHVLSRDATCVGPACEHTARGTQLDHTVDHARPGPSGQVGTTSEANLGPLCRRAHGAKTHGGWHLEQPAPGTFRWTSPTGRTYARAARPLVPGWRRLVALLGGSPVRGAASLPPGGQEGPAP